MRQHRNPPNIISFIALSQQKPRRYVPHVRTLRRAREQVISMVAAGFSTLEIRNYLRKWTLWWARTSEAWQLEELLNWFISACWELPIAAGLLARATSLHTDSSTDCLDVA